MEVSKPPKDILGLGQHLVHELHIQRSDTLGRWMAHHIAELMHEAEHGETAAKRIKARKAATETILKIWEHRAALPGNAYPLAPYQEVLRVLERLQPDDNPFSFSPHDKTEKERLAGDLFYSLTRLIIVTLWMRVSSWKKIAKVKTITAAIAALEPAERRIFQAFQQWSEVLPLKKTSAGQKRGSKKDNPSATVNWNEVSIEWIDHITVTLAELRSEFQKDVGTVKK
jgi:hypothetical protein